jgi:hypothetical protein
MEVFVLSLLSVQCYDFPFGQDCAQSEVKVLVLGWRFFSVDAVSG